MTQNSQLQSTTAAEDYDNTHSSFQNDSDLRVQDPWSLKLFRRHKAQFALHMRWRPQGARPARVSSRFACFAFLVRICAFLFSAGIRNNNKSYKARNKTQYQNNGPLSQRSPGASDSYNQRHSTKICTAPETRARAWSCRVFTNQNRQISEYEHSTQRNQRHFLPLGV